MISTDPPLNQDHKYLTYFETLRVPGAAHMYTWIFAGGLAGGAASLGFLRWRAPTLLGTFAVLGLCIAIVPLTMKAVFAVLLSWIPNVPTFLRQGQALRPEWEGWFQQVYDTFASSRVPCYVGIVEAAVAVLAFWAGGAIQRLPSVVALLCLVIAAGAGFVCGVGLASIFFLGRLIWLFGRHYAIRQSDHGYGILSTGRMLVKCYSLIAVAWCLVTTSAAWGINDMWLPILLLAVPALIFFVGSFVVCQFPLHRQMVECKRATLIELDDLLERLTPKEPDGMSEDRKRQLDFYLAEIERVRKWPEWPFHVGNLSGVLGASLGAIAPQLIKIVFPILSTKNS